MEIQWYPGHMAKTRRMIEENLKLIDVVVEILDARIPYSGRNPNFDDIIKNKPRLVVMNKYDLADPKITDAWIAWYKSNGTDVVPVSCKTGMGINKITSAAESLISERLERERAKGLNRNIKIMMVGIPNVGKSTIINKLSGKASAKTGDKPGVTRGKQWITLKDGAELLDTPGVLPTKMENQEVAKRLAYTGAVRDEIIDTELLVYSLLEYLRDNYAQELMQRYKIEFDENTEGWDLLERIGKKRGCVISGGEINTERAANIVLDELRGAVIGRMTLETPQQYEEQKNNE